MSGIVKIHNKEYKTVALRVNEMRSDSIKKEWSIETELVHNNPELVIMKATIKNEAQRVMGTGWAEEIRGSSNINKTSALENCETSAIGRALAAIGLAGEEYASANEVSEAIIKQKQNEVVEHYVAYMESVKAHWDEIVTIKEGLANMDNPELLSAAAATWYEMTEESRKAIWKAPTKGGVFTLDEKALMSDDRFRAAHFGDKDYGDPQ